MISKLNWLIGPAAAVTLLTGCATTHDSRVDAEWGQAVREMVQLQTLDPAAEERNSGTVSESMDGVATEQVLDAYRNRVSKPESVSQDIVINVGD